MHGGRSSARQHTPAPRHSMPLAAAEAAFIRIVEIFPIGNLSLSRLPFLFSQVRSCAHEWSKNESSADNPETSPEVRGSVGNVLRDGDSVTVIKDLRVRGSSLVVKVGTKVKNIRLVEGDHDIDCKIDGIGSMGLKSEFVKKA